MWNELKIQIWDQDPDLNVSCRFHPHFVIYNNNYGSRSTDYCTRNVLVSLSKSLKQPRWVCGIAIIAVT